MVLVQPKTEHILIVEDHALSSAGYKLILEGLGNMEDGPTYMVKTALTLGAAYDCLMAGDGYFDIVLLDIRMKACPELKLFSGEDLGKLIVERFPDTKIIVLTSILDRFRLDGILKSLEPAGFLIKTEVDPNTLKLALAAISEGDWYYSGSIRNLLRDRYIKGIELDSEEREFLYLLSIGVPSAGIPDHLPWSLSKVEKKKRKLRDQLKVEERNIMALIHKARELGII